MTTLADFDDYRPKSKSGLLRRVIIGFIATFSVLIALGLAFVGAFATLFSWGNDQTIKEIGPKETTEQVAGFLYYWHLSEPEIYHKEEYRKDGTLAVVSQLTRDIPGLHGIRGFSESGGWNGDGTDFYEAALSPRLVEQLKNKLNSSSFGHSKAFPPGGKYKPDWWPTEWPPDAVCYTDGYLSFIFSPGEGELWIYVIRS